MGSKSSSNQSTEYNTNTTYTYNHLDGGAIEEAFDFAREHSDNAFDFATEHSENAFDAVTNVAGEAFDSVDHAFRLSMEHSESQLNQMSALVKSTQTQGATELISANRDSTRMMYLTMGVVMVLMIVMMWVGRRA